MNITHNSQKPTIFSAYSKHAYTEVLRPLENIVTLLPALNQVFIAQCSPYKMRSETLYRVSDFASFVRSFCVRTLGGWLEFLFIYIFFLPAPTKLLKFIFFIFSSGGKTLALEEILPSVRKASFPAYGSLIQSDFKFIRRKQLLTFFHKRFKCLWMLAKI